MDVYDKLTLGNTDNNTNETNDDDKPKTKFDVALESLEDKVGGYFDKAAERLPPTSEALGGWWNKFTTDLKKGFDELANEASTSGGTGETENANDKTNESSTETLTQAKSVSESSNNESMLSVLTQKSQQYLDTLDRELAGIEDKAAGYLGETGSTVKNLLQSAVRVDAPRKSFDENEGEDASTDVLFNVPDDIRNDIYSTRLGAQLHALHTSEAPFIDVDTSRDEEYQKFKNNFNVEESSERIANDLKEHAKLQNLMDKLVPTQVSYADFWTKYYYMREKIDQQEAKRKNVFASVGKGAEEELEKWDYDSSDEEEEGDKKASSSTTNDKKKEESRSSSERSYVEVDKNTPGLKENEQDQKAGAVKKEEDSEDDDDWE